LLRLLSRYDIAADIYARCRRCCHAMLIRLRRFSPAFRAATRGAMPMLRRWRHTRAAMRDFAADDGMFVDERRHAMTPHVAPAPPCHAIFRHCFFAAADAMPMLSPPLFFSPLSMLRRRLIFIFRCCFAIFDADFDAAMIAAFAFFRHIFAISPFSILP
jgi:hypothetical protein